MATSTEQYRQYPPPPSNYPAQGYQQQQYQETASVSPRKGSQNPPAHNRTFSFHSQKSHKSSGSKDLQETHAEKEAKRLHSKADPTLAISEAEPSAIAAMMTESSFAPLRSMQHKDAFGNSIADPDKSNPTRNRWERPLDTIRSFEAAIDGGYSRKSLYRAETDSQANWNRRNSSYNSQPRFPRDNYYNNRPVSFRPENQFENGSTRSNYFDGQAYSNGFGTGPSRQRMSRMQSEPQYQSGHDQNIYPLPHKDRSYETVTSAAGSGNSDHAGYQTDPTSSDNSSIDRTMPAKRREPLNEYASGSYQPQQPYQSRPWPASGSGVNNEGQPQPPPPSHSHLQPPTTQAQASVPPQKQKNTLLRRTSTHQSTYQPQQAAGGDKRKSWFSRRFSKNS
ncbi:uncharacterized protein FFB20_04559 [Fusarium fujikuroi]|uniref:DUF2406 domain protein n=2 Tax=Fusarium fujikuroi TaxID=5127 RepID=S0DKX5_GIBF5|nr:uncharacterized protein FFUJ_01473 [Fusarium fujikuroi IMI 58289]KLO90165.1 uncharacterized protein LW93_13775 [Fusarium fujikuroi]KLO98149.1 uncharacterized protein Y057_14662 [Fusarium fujikuroi]KLP06108.1 uncharacterized protein LW94_7055 [Fusarium fujikuroi]CCT62017.1 uncharacterized protein FFUJ_01473 [Fusarium fujikuroi IMI 58289]SCN72636.1 uncharacterized protein FFC1_01567 [Fusarium fujikuroi]